MRETAPTEQATASSVGSGPSPSCTASAQGSIPIRTSIWPSPTGSSPETGEIRRVRCDSTRHVTSTPSAPRGLTPILQRRILRLYEHRGLLADADARDMPGTHRRWVGRG
jgi:hypothetical protein